MELTYHFCTMALALLIFFMKFTAKSDGIELILKVLGKIIPLFVMLYSGINIFQHFGII